MQRPHVHCNPTRMTAQLSAIAPRSHAELSDARAPTA
jgi:hypothetical protein